MAVTMRFSKDKFRKELLKRKEAYEVEQTARLIAYAQEEMQKMGNLIDQIITNVDFNTGNLLDSLCWGVWHNKRKCATGFYREMQATYDSYLHELSKDKIPVNGRLLAEQFLQEYQDHLTVDDGWQIVWGVLAPYYVYWEEGHINVLFGGEFAKFDAMSQRYDHIENVLKPRCKTGFWTILNA